MKTYAAVATFCGVSEAVINLMRNDRYETKGDDKWLQVGAKLGWRAGSTSGRREWITVETRDIRSISTVVADAKNNSLFIAIAAVGGICKSEGLKYVMSKNPNQDIYYIRCKDWGKTEWLENLCQTLGIQVTGIRKPNKMLDAIIDFFQQRSLNAPVLLVDEFNKLKDSARLTLIPLYNECEDSLGMVIAGPEDLKKSIETGVRYQKRGYDELYSRIGRTFIELLGCTLNEVISICKANGYEDTEKIKAKFEQHKPQSKIITIGGQQSRIRVISDLRWIKTMVKINRNRS